jgi:hypothetical protein
MSNLKQAVKMTLRISIAVLCLLYLGQDAFCQEVIKHENQEISLQGTIRLIHGYGPPGYGEDPKHDSRVSYWALEVPVPVNTPCTESDFGCDPAKRLKLFFPNIALERLNDLPAAKWKDQVVVIVGKLHHADTAGEMTPIYIDVTNISAAPNQKVQRKKESER